MATESVKPSARARASEPPAELDLEGEVLADRYEVQAPLGEGGLGVVYRALDRQTGKPVAVKVLRELYGAQQAFRRRFAREARALSALDHPHVVAIVDSGVTADMPYLVMELLVGTSLAEVFVAQHTLPWERARSLFVQLLDGLAYVHAQGLLHRDLKPGNVFIEACEDGERVKLLDFGLAKFVDAPSVTPEATLTKTGQLFGTPGYMPPEQLLGQRADARSDVYSATLILFEMLAGQRPFYGNLSEMAKQQLSGQVPTLQQLRPSMRAEPALHALFERGLASDPRRRFPHVLALREAFDALPDPPVVPFGRPLSSDISKDDTVLQRRTGGAKSDAASVEPSTKVATGSSSTQSEPQGGVDPETHVYRPPGPSLWGSMLRWMLFLSATALFVVGLGWRHLLPLIGSDEAQDTEEELVPEGEAGTAPVAAQVEGQGGSQEAAARSAAEQAPVEDTPPRWRAPARDPWRGATPTHLREIRRRVERGSKGDETMIAALRRHNRDYPNDPRGHLLLARMYRNRGWQRDMVTQYEFAVLRQPSARGDSQMLGDLLALHDGSSWSEAAKLIAETYGAEAKKPLARRLRGKLAPRSRHRLKSLLSALPDAEP